MEMKKLKGVLLFRRACVQIVFMAEPIIASCVLIEGIVVICEMLAKI